MDYKNFNIQPTTFAKIAKKNFLTMSNHDTCSYCDNLPIYTFTDYQDGQSVILGSVCDKHFIRMQIKLGQVKLQLVNRKAKQRKRDKRKKTESIKAYRRVNKKKRKFTKKNTP